MLPQICAGPKKHTTDDHQHVTIFQLFHYQNNYQTQEFLKRQLVHLKVLHEQYIICTYNLRVNCLRIYSFYALDQSRRHICRQQLQFIFLVNSLDEYKFYNIFEMYGVGYGANVNAQNTMIQMNPMMGGMGMGMGMMNPNVFMFSGNSISLQSRLDSLTDAECERFLDANITITGLQVNALNTCGLMCTVVWGSFFIFPLCFMCCDWWKRCIYPSYTISHNVYMSLGKILRAPNLKNITITVVDSNFDEAKARILYNFLAEGRVRGFTFVNGAGNYNYQSNEFSNFIKNMRPIKTLNNVTSDMRWATEIVLA